MAEIKLTAENFENEVLKADKPVLVDFWAEWCGPCKMLAPIVDEIAEEYSDKIKVCKLNVDDEVAVALQFNIQSIPALLLFENGVVVKKTVGYALKEKIVEELGL